MKLDDKQTVDAHTERSPRSNELSGAFLEFAELIGRRIADRWRVSTEARGASNYQPPSNEIMGVPPAPSVGPKPIVGECGETPTE